MSKNLQKTLAGALATISTVSIATPVMATSVDIDTVYKNAYDAMRKAQAEDTQDAINEARVAINELLEIGKEKNDEHLINAACTWSSEVDKVQHPKLVKIVDAITKAQETGRQADINAAFATIEENLPDEWKNSYSSAIDLVQRKLQDELVKAVEKAENDKTEETVKAARELVNEVLTADNKAMVEWASIFAGRLDLIVLDGTANDDCLIDQEVSDLNITDITVNRKQITINFTKTNKSLDDVTLTILDNNGKEVKVKSIDTIQKGETEATFEFVNYLSVAPTGVWNVNGVSFNLTEKAFVEAVKSANDDTQLGAVLTMEAYKGLVTYNEDRLASYVAELKKAESLKEVKDIQDVIDAVDAKLDKEQEVITSKEQYIELLKEVVEIGTQGQFDNLLNQGVELGYIKNINPEHMKDYKEEIRNKGNDVEEIKDIQTQIDNVNNKKVDAAKNALEKALGGNDKKEILTALQNSLLGLDNVKAENINHYVLEATSLKAKLEKETDSLKQTNELLEIINKKANVVNAKTSKEMLTALVTYSDIQKIDEFNDLSQGKRQDTVEELLNSLSPEKEYRMGAIENEIVKASSQVIRKLTNVNNALVNLANDRGDIKIEARTEANTTALRNALKEIIGNEISVTQADTFYNNSIKNGELVDYTNYTDVRTAFNK